MDQSSPYQPLRPSSEGPNPLRPYYRPPSIGNPPLGDTNGSSLGANGRSTGGSGAGNIFSGISYNDVLGEGRGWKGISIKRVLDDAVWKYSSVFMAQPFEVAKTVLQVRLNEAIRDAEKGSMSASRASSTRYQESTTYSSSSDSDSPSYFTSAAPNTPSYAQPGSHRKRRSRHSHSDHDPSTHKSQIGPAQPPHRLHLKKHDSLTEILSQLWSREGSWGVWKGTNATFLYSVLFKTLEAWTRSTFAALLNLPDPGFSASAGLGPASSTIGGLDIIDSPSPVASLGVAVVAAAIAGTLLAPLDIVRTRLMLTPTNTDTTPRSILPCLRDLQTWTCPTLVLPSTVLHATLPSVFSTTTPLLLRNFLNIDPVITPATYSVSTFLSAAAELFVRLPVETVLRRGQMRVVVEAEDSRLAREAQARSTSRGRRRKAQASPYDDEEEVDPAVTDATKLDTVVPIGPYTGIIATMWRISRDEGERVESPVTAVAQSRSMTARRKRRGQGVMGLWRGWRVGWWGLVGVWGASALGSAAGKGGEF